MNQLRQFVPLRRRDDRGRRGLWGSTDSGPQAASVTGVAGDNQTAPTGAALAFPLSFVALGSSGQPAQGCMSHGA